MNYIQQQYGNMPQRQTYQSNGWNNRIRPVSSIEEVRATSIDFDGSVFYFPDLANRKIYTKQINLDGTAQLNMYELKEIPPVMEQPIVDTSKFVTRGEFEDLVNRLKNFLTASNSEARTPAAADVPATPEPRSFEF